MTKGRERGRIRHRRARCTPAGVRPARPSSRAVAGRVRLRRSPSSCVVRRGGALLGAGRRLGAVRLAAGCGCEQVDRHRHRGADAAAGARGRRRTRRTRRWSRWTPTRSRRRLRERTAPDRLGGRGPVLAARNRSESDRTQRRCCWSKRARSSWKWTTKASVSPRFPKPPKGVPLLEMAASSSRSAARVCAASARSGCAREAVRAGRPRFRPPSRAETRLGQGPLLRLRSHWS